MRMMVRTRMACLQGVIIILNNIIILITYCPITDLLPYHGSGGVDEMMVETCMARSTDPSMAPFILT